MNCIPVFIAREAYWRQRFEQHNLPIIGDDIKSQVGATIVHRVLTRLFRERGVKIDRTYQLNFGGNTDFMNMLEREPTRVEEDLEDQRRHQPARLRPGAPTTSTSGRRDYVPWLLDRKWCLHPPRRPLLRRRAAQHELKLEVWDSPNSAGVVIDAVRCAKLALDRGIGGALEGPSSYFMKSPPVQYSDDEARNMTEQFIEGRTRDSRGRHRPTGRWRA